MNAPMDAKLPHGGELVAISEQYDRPLEQWLDLSTGISPEAWPVPEIPQSVWQRLPDRDQLETVALAYYACGPVLPLAVPGSQWAIEQIPRLLDAGGVAMPAITYAEHPAAWRTAGHRLYLYHDWSSLDALLKSGDCRYLVLVAPGNPCGQRPPEGAIADWRKRLGPRGLCVVDEAFQDVHESEGLDAISDGAELIRLRSVGKFFGLAGLRLGFVLADEARRRQLASYLSPWSVSHPARYVGALALADKKWHTQQRQLLWRSCSALLALLQQHLPDTEWYSAGLFVSARLPLVQARHLYRRMAEQGVLLRLRDDAPSASGEVYVRVGLPPESGWQTLKYALERMKDEI